MIKNELKTAAPLIEDKCAEWIYRNKYKFREKRIHSDKEVATLREMVKK